METPNRLRTAAMGIVVLGVLGLTIQRSSSAPALAANAEKHKGPLVTIGAPLPLPITGSVTASGSVSVTNLPHVQDVRVLNPSLTVNLSRTPVHDGTFFNITQPGGPPFLEAVTLTVPAGVVLTDARATFSVPENFPNSASLIVRHASQYFIYQIVNNTTFNAGINLESGIVSDGSLNVELSCYNIAGNHCQGALMWSGYAIP